MEGIGGEDSLVMDTDDLMKGGQVESDVSTPILPLQLMCS
jgi:hypothetical protein